jgi:hypothetical protein
MAANDNLSPAAGTLAAWRRATRWRQESGGDVFPTQSAFEWFYRQHFAELVASGEFMPGTGRRGHLVGPKIDAVVLGILRRQSGAIQR